MSDTMRAIDISGGAGSASALFINASVPRPVPAPEECLVRVRAFGLNRGDIVQREGKYPDIGHLPKILGLEFSGIVESVGQIPLVKTEEHRHAKEALDNDSWKKGDEVFGLLYGGSYAEYVTVDKRMLIAKPKELSWEFCGGLCETWFTAVQALHLVGAYDWRTTRSILWHAGTSAVSIAGIQLSLAADRFAADETLGTSPIEAPKVFATTRRNDKCEFCVNVLGCTDAVNTSVNTDGGWAEKIKKLNGGQGIDLVIDFVGGPYFQTNLDVLAHDGRVVQLGLLGGPTVQEPLNIGAFVLKRISFAGSTLRSRDLEYQAKVRDLFERTVLPLLVNGRFQHFVERTFSWREVGEAHKLLESNDTKGKIVCFVD